MINASKQNLLSLLAGKSSKSIKQSPPRHDQVNKGKSILEAELIQALGALRSVSSKKSLLAE
jgi:hypothetical protein